MADVEMMDIAELWETYTDDAAVDEATHFPTLPTGYYDAKLDQRKIFEGGTDERFPDRLGRQYAEVSAPAMKDDKKVGRIRFALSWIEKRTATGRLDRMSSAYNQIKGALGLKGKPVAEVLETMMKYPLNIGVQELVFNPTKENKRGEKGTWEVIPNDAERTAKIVDYIRKRAEAKAVKPDTRDWNVINSVNSIRKVKV